MRACVLASVRLLQMSSESVEQVLSTWPASVDLSPEAACAALLDHLDKEGLSDDQVKAIRGIGTPRI
jgi:hypothetical protein